MLRMRFTPDGRTLVTTGRRRAGARVGRRARHRRPAASPDTAGAIDGLDLTRDGRTLITGSVDTTRDPLGPRGRSSPRPALPRRQAIQARLHAEGDRGQPGRTNARGHARRRCGRPDRHPDPAPAPRAARAGRHRPVGRLQSRRTPAGGHRASAAASRSGTRGRWRRQASSRGCGATPRRLAFSPDGTLLAAAEADPAGPFLPRPLRVWDVRTRTLTGVPRPERARHGRVQPGRRADRRRGGPAGHRDTRRRHGPRSSSGSSRETSPTPSRSRRTVSCSSSGSTTAAGSSSRRRPGSRSAVRSRATPGASRPPSSRATVARSSPPPPTGPRCSGTSRPRSRSDRRSSSRRARSRRPRSAPTARGCSPSPPAATASASSCHGRPGSATPACVAGRELTAAEWADALPARPYQAVCSGD